MQIFWQKSIGGYDSEYPKYINQTEDGGIIVIGTTYSNDGDVSGNHSNPGWDTDIWAVKLDSTGEIEWQKSTDGGANWSSLSDTGTQITLASSESVGKYTTASVVTSIFLIILTDFFFTFIFQALNI